MARKMTDGTTEDVIRRGLPEGGRGFLRVKRSVNGLKFLRTFDPHISDLAGLITGVKPVVYADIVEDDWPYIRDLCRAFRLKYLMPGPGKSGKRRESAKKMLLIGGDMRKLKLAAKCYAESEISPEWGRLLGYPECCVRAYIKWCMTRETDIIRFIRGNTAGPGPFSFFLNNVVNFFSRVRFGGEDGRRYRGMIDINREIGIPMLQVISWHPCTYRCAGSIRKGGEIFSFLESFLPEFALRLKTYLAKPVVFFDKYEFAVLKGRVSGKRVEYNSLFPPFSLLGPKARGVISSGRSITAGREGAIVRPGARLVRGEAGLPPLILDFTSGTGTV